MRCCVTSGTTVMAIAFTRVSGKPYLIVCFNSRFLIQHVTKTTSTSKLQQVQYCRFSFKLVSFYPGARTYIFRGGICQRPSVIRSANILTVLVIEPLIQFQATLGIKMEFQIFSPMFDCEPLHFSLCSQCHICLKKIQSPQATIWVQTCFRPNWPFVLHAELGPRLATRDGTLTTES